MRTALRTAVTTALLAGLAVTPVVATGTAFAADGPAATAETPAAAAETPPAGTLVRTETLYNGTVVKIYKLGPSWYRAESFKNGQSIGTVEANGRPAAGNDNGNFLVLTEDGRTWAWQGNYAQPTRSGTYRLADGTLLQLEKDSEAQKAGIRLIVNGKGFGGFSYVTTSDLRKVFYMGKDAVVVLEYDGGLAAYIPGGKRQSTPEYFGPGIVTPEPNDGPPEEILSGPTATAPCTVTEVIASSYGVDKIVTLTNDLKKGPKAVLQDKETGKVLDTVDRAHPGPTGLGLKIVRGDTLTPRFGQHTNGGDSAPYRWNDFPKLPKGCEKPSTTPPTATATPAPTTGSGTTGGQTTVVPQGGVAAGAEIGSVEQGNDTALLASGAGAAAVVAAGLGFTAMRRRTNRG